MPFSTIEDHKAELVRKALQGSVLIAEVTADAIAALTTGAESDLTALPEGYTGFGWLSEEGIGFGRTTTQSDINAFGSSQPVRSDVTSDVTTMTCNSLETRLATIKVKTGADDAALEADATTGEVSVEKPARPPSKYWRVLAIAVDTDDQGREIYIARFLPRAKVTSFGDESWQSGDTAIQTGVTFTAFEDSTLGYSDKLMWGGPGWKALLTSMGIVTATP